MADDVFVTQTVIETTESAPSGLQVTQTVVEFSHKTVSDVLVTQLVIEYVKVVNLPPPLIGGIYFINPVKTGKFDSYYNNANKQIPDPTIRTALIGE